MAPRPKVLFTYSHVVQDPYVGVWQALALEEGTIIYFDLFLTQIYNMTLEELEDTVNDSQKNVSMVLLYCVFALFGAW